MQDIVIVGGGMVGTAAAIGLAQLGLNITLIEPNEPRAYDSTAPFDLRVSAISVFTEKLLERLACLKTFKSMRHIPYEGLETWEIDGFITRFHAEQIGCSHLGYIAENRIIQLSLWQRMAELSNIRLLCPAKVTAFEQNNDSITVSLNTHEQIQTRLVIGADGAHSKVRQWANIGVTGWDYAQSAMLINIETSEELPNITWQQFTPQGPRALLPLSSHMASLVWYDSPLKIAQLSTLNHKQLAEQIKRHFPSRLSPDFTLLSKGSFPLTRRHAQRYYEKNILIIGDAAHTINPLAGQGVNLGFKDVSALMDVMAAAINNNEPFWQAKTLKQYQRARYNDNLLMMSMMDAFYASFSNDILPLKLLRNIGLKAADNSGIIKKQVLKYALGME